MTNAENNLVSLADAEQCICTHCQWSIIGICPQRGNEPWNPEKTICPTIMALRSLKRYPQQPSQDGPHK